LRPENEKNQMQFQVQSLFFLDADIGQAGRIIADQYHAEAWMNAAAAHAPQPAGDIGIDFFGDDIAFE
jgi:hypothetical protein